MRRSTSPPPPPPPPLAPSGLLTSSDKAGASTHTPRPDHGGSSTAGRPLRRENSETRLSDLEVAMTKLENYPQAIKDTNMQINDVRAGEKVVELIAKIYKELPPRMQEKLRAELNATIFQGAQEDDGPPKIQRTGTRRLIDWTTEHIILPIGFGLLVAFIIRLFYWG